MRTVLTIAGSDPSGGAGIQADLKTMCALGVYGMSVITAVTVQNTAAVEAVQEIDREIVTGQIRAVFEDIPPEAVKIGMVSSGEIIGAIGESLRRFHARHVVLDPVMVSKSGFRLLRPEAVEAVKTLLPLAEVVTPNIPEAEILAGLSIRDEAGMREAARAIAQLGAKNILVKGGHRLGEDARDLLYEGEAGGRYTVLPGRRIPTKNTHGTGCTLSSAIACFLARGLEVAEAAAAAKAYITQAIEDALDLGRGNGPVGHLCALYRRAGLDPAGSLAYIKEETGIEEKGGNA